MKTLLSFCLALLLQVMFSGHARAAVSGDCVNCHTMHNSQDGSAVTYTVDTTFATGGGSFSTAINGTSTANASLLKTDCVGCHTNTSNGQTIVMLGNSRVPIVYNPGGGVTYPDTATASGSNNTLAGGNFYWVNALGDNFGHNVYGISGQDGTLSSAPGVDADACGECHGTLATPNTGCNGCHVPAHHMADSNTVAGQGQGWYRFLGSAMGVYWESGNPKARVVALTAPGTMGIEDNDWEQTVGPNDHNVYKGTTNYYNQSTGWYGYDNWNHTTGFVCTGCHSNFHHFDNGTGSASDNQMTQNGVWIRHPNDVVLPSSGEYSNYNSYDPRVPVGVPDLSVGVTNSVTPGTDIVMCLSCHRAHGSPYPDMLRWDYTNECQTDTTAANSCGCFTCHTTKDGI